MSASESAEDGGVDLVAMLAERYESPQARGAAFERLMQRALQCHPDVYGPQRFARVWRWAEWPEREALGYGADIGIDLVAEQADDAGGGLCAIQTKAYATGRVDKGAVDSFISASATDDFTARLLVLTAPPTAQARLMIEKASPRCEVLHRSDLESWPVNWAECLDDPLRLRFAAEDRHTPKPFQADAVARVVAGFAENDRGRLVLPCGTGKSVVSLWVAEQMAGIGGRVLYLVPSIALMNQTMREWASQRDPSVPHRYIGVCSDTRAGHTSEDAPLVELAMPVTTDPDRITAQLTATDTSAMTVVFCTYQSLSLIADAQSSASLLGPAPAFDLAICDEAHRTTGIEETAARKPASGSQRTVTPYSLIHDPSRVRVAKRLYMTATPRVYTESARSRVQKAAGSFDVYSMDDPAVYGPEMYRMSFGDAVEGGHLTDYKVLVIAVAENPVLDAYDNIAIDEEHQFKIHDAVRFAGCWDGLADPTTTTPEDRVTGAVNHDYAAQRVIAFTNRIRNSQLVERYWNPVIEAVAGAVHGRPSSEGNGAAAELLACDIRHVDGNKNALERADTIAWLRAGDPEGACRIVTNARCLSEGIDVPALDAVIFLEPKQSQVDVIQAVGRVMRRAPHKDVGYVILPVVVPSGTSLLDDAVLNGSDFKAVWKVLKALRSHDERLDVLINTADLTGKPPITVLPSGLCGTCGKADSDCECDQTRLDDAASVRAGQQRLPFEHAIASQLVKACGDRQYWDRWGREVARITGTITSHIRTAVGADADLAATFDRFAEQMQATVGGSVAAGDLAALVAQHVVTMPVFEALFAGSGFADRNPVSKALNELLDEFKAADVRLRDETADLDRFYDSVRNRLSGAADSDARLKIMLEVYESFFKEAMPAEITRLGIVYTPVELVDFNHPVFCRDSGCCVTARSSSRASRTWRSASSTSSTTASRASEQCRSIMSSAVTGCSAPAIAKHTKRCSRRSQPRRLPSLRTPGLIECSRCSGTPTMPAAFATSASASSTARTRSGTGTGRRSHSTTAPTSTCSCEETAWMREPPEPRRNAGCRSADGPARTSCTDSSSGSSLRARSAEKPHHHGSADSASTSTCPNSTWPSSTKANSTTGPSKHSAEPKRSPAPKNATNENAPCANKMASPSSTSDTTHP